MRIGLVELIVIVIVAIALIKPEKLRVSQNAHPHHIGCAFPFLRPCTDRRRRSGAQTSGTDVKRSRTGRRSVRVPRRIPRKGEFGLVLPRTFVFCVIPSHPTIFKLSQLHIHFLSLVFVLIA